MEVVEEHIYELEKNGIWDLLALKSNPKVIILKYEDFAFNWDYAFREIEKFIGEEIATEARTQCVEKFSIDVVAKKAATLGAFSNRDLTDRIHGKHISKFWGRPGYYSEYLNREMIDKAYATFSPLFSEFDYEPPKGS